MTYKLETFDGAGGWYWRLVASNGRIIAVGGESYASASNARRAAKRFLAIIDGAVRVELAK